MSKRLQINDMRDRWGLASPAVVLPKRDGSRPHPVRTCLPGGTLGRLFLAVLLLLALAGCAKYNTYYNAKKAFDQAELVRTEAIRKHEDPPKPAGLQKSSYELSIQKAQTVLDEYPGHDLTDDALFLQAKAWHRLEGYRMSIRKFDLLFRNFPASEYSEEALYLQGLNYLLINSLDKSREYLTQLERRFPDSEFQSETLKVSGDNAFALEKWAEAADAYRRYLDENRRAQERDRIGLKLAECLWELDDYDGAADVLKEVSENSTSAELSFRARLLRARVYVRIGDYELADALLAGLSGEAEIYGARGDVRLAEAESMVAQQRPDDAVTLLEAMPPDWATPSIKARSSEMLGDLYMVRGDWEKARASYQEAQRRRSDLEDPERVRRLGDTLKDYMAADQALVDANGAKAASLRLEKANALLFGFERPQEAVGFYAAAATDTSAERTVAARSLYGAFITYRDYLDEPDSARFYADQLESRYPDSPQAYEARSGGEADLLGYLLARRQLEQEARLAAMTPEERLALESGETSFVGDLVRRNERGDGLRRRTVYLARRSNLQFPATEQELAVEAQRAQADRALASRNAASDSVRAAAESAAAAAAAAADTTGAAPPPAGAEVGGALPAAATSADSLQGLNAEQAAEDTLTDEEKAEEAKKEEKKKNRFDLRSPAPAPDPGPRP